MPTGNAVSLIESNYMGFGSGVVDPATGIHYQNRGSYFSLDPGHANVLAPRKRTLHTLLPGMLFREDAPDRPWVVAGSMGGDAQPQVHAQLVSALVDGGLDIRTAVSAPRWYVAAERHFAPPTVLHIEPRFEPGVLEALASMGHDVQPGEAFDSRARPRARDRAHRGRPVRRRRIGRRSHRSTERRPPRGLVTSRQADAEALAPPHRRTAGFTAGDSARRPRPDSSGEP